MVRIRIQDLHARHCQLVKDAKAMRKMHALAGAGSLPVEARGTLSLSLSDSLVPL
jgi:hypothetical protein